MDAPLSPQILATHLSPADPAADARFLAALAADATGAVVPPVEGVASASASDDTAPVDDSRPPTAPLIDAAEGTVPLVAGSAADMSSDAAATADDAGAPLTDVAEGTVPPVAEPSSMPLLHLQKRAPWPPTPTDAVRKTVPPVAGAAAGTAADAAPADDAGASTTPFDDAAGKTRVPVTAAAAGAAAASATAVGADCCGSSAVDIAVRVGGCCRYPSNRENIGTSSRPSEANPQRPSLR